MKPDYYPLPPVDFSSMSHDLEDVKPKRVRRQILADFGPDQLAEFWKRFEKNATTASR
jgi:hypothetical protein